MKKWVKVIVWGAVAIAGLVAVVSLAAGPIATAYLSRHGEEAIGRKVSVDRVGLNLFSGSVTVRGLAVYEEDGEQTFASLDTFHIRVNLLQLPFRAVNIRRLTVSGLNANILQDGDDFNFTSLVNHFSKEEDEKDTTASKWTVGMHNVRLSHAKLKYKDMQSNKGFMLPDVNLRIPAFSIGGEEQSEGGLNIRFQEGGGLRAALQHDAATGKYHLEADLDGFDLQNVAEMAAEYIEFEELEGLLQVHLTADGNMEHLMQSNVAGNVQLEKAVLFGWQGRVLDIDTVVVVLNSANIEAGVVDLGRVEVQGLRAWFEQRENGNTLDFLLKTRQDTTVDKIYKDEPMAEASRQEHPMRVTVGSLSIRRGIVCYDDFTLPKTFSLMLENINVSGNNFDSRGNGNATLKASLVRGGGLLSVHWHGSIDNWKAAQDLELEVKGFDMKQLNPLIVAYTGRPFDDGVLGLRSRIIVHNGTLDNDNHIDIYNAMVGKRRYEVVPRTKIPLKTAVYVLKDKDGKILVDLPVSGDLNNPEFNYMRVLWKTLGQLLVKVSTSPLRAVAGAMGIGNEDIEFMQVEPAQQTLTSEQYHKLGQLAFLVKTDSLLSLTLQHQYSAEADTATLHLLDSQIQQYVAEQGIDARRFRIKAAEPGKEDQRTGYVIGSEIHIEE